MEKKHIEEYRDGLAEDLKDLRSQEKEKASMFLKLAQETQRYKEAKEAHVRGRQEEDVSGDKISETEKKEESLNVLGLPSNWARDMSAQSLEYIRQQLQGYDFRSGPPIIPSGLLAHVFKVTSQEYKKYRPKHVPVSTTEVSGDSGLLSELEYLKMSREDKLKYFRGRWPEGFKISGTDKCVKWDKVVDFDLWAMGNHGQTLATLQRRGGLSPFELLHVLAGVRLHDLTASGEQILEWFKEINILA